LQRATAATKHDDFSPENRAFDAQEVSIMNFDLILPFLRPIEPLLLDDSISEIMGNPDSSWWYERDGVMHRDESIPDPTGPGSGRNQARLQYPSR
jgi:hypothetical protein